MLFNVLRANVFVAAMKSDCDPAFIRMVINLVGSVTSVKQKAIAQQS